jgi:tRNA pseudouridine38-40 synthase
MVMRTLKITIAYDGTNYVGWQRQDNGLSVQQVVEDALRPFLDDEAAPIALLGASRTDAGVHAAEQVASVRVPFTTPVDAIERALNIRMPGDVRALQVEDVPESFHARFDSRSKQYRYRIATTRVLSPFDRLYVWHLPYALDLEAMRAAGAMLVGRHDFASFQASGAATVDTIREVDRVDVVSSPGSIDIVVEGNGFLRHMVRIMVGSLVEVGSGRKAVDWMAAVLAEARRESAGPTAPAHGLILEHVRY